MRRVRQIDNFYFFVPPLLGVGALLCLQERCILASVILGLAFLVLGIIGAIKVKVYWK